ncbi:MAG: BamA/TamA family outer membrane protein [Comamonadaceae bacterium]|nr:BamA/TamA family outer membrane protein [Comamonadaceae bacterium]
MLDLSEHLLEHRGILPVPITWQADRYRYLGALGKVDARLDYYGPLGKPRAYQLDGVGLMQQFQARAGETDWFFGPRYAWLKVNPAFGDGWPADLDGRPLREVRIGRLSLVGSHDTRDNIFTPTDGHFVEAELVAASPQLGGTSSYQQVNLRGFDWIPMGKPFILALRGDVQTSRGDLPFFVQTLRQPAGHSRRALPGQQRRRGRGRALVAGHAALVAAGLYRRRSCVGQAGHLQPGRNRQHRRRWLPLPHCQEAWPARRDRLRDRPGGSGVLHSGRKPLALIPYTRPHFRHQTSKETRHATSKEPITPKTPVTHDETQGVHDPVPGHRTAVALAAGLRAAGVLGVLGRPDLLQAAAGHHAARGDGHPVLVIPGLGASDISTILLRRFLDDLGYVTYPGGWGATRGSRTRTWRSCTSA